MAKIVSKRRRAEQARTAENQRLEEKYLGTKPPMSADEEARIRRVFEHIRRQLDSVGDVTREHLYA